MLQIASSPLAFADDALTLPAFMPCMGMRIRIADRSEEAGNGYPSSLFVNARKAPRSQYSI